MPNRHDIELSIRNRIIDLHVETFRAVSAKKKRASQELGGKTCSIRHIKFDSRGEGGTLTTSRVNEVLQREGRVRRSLQDRESGILVGSTVIEDRPLQYYRFFRFKSDWKMCI